MNNKSTYLYEIPDGDGTDAETTIRVVNEGDGIYIEISRIRTTTSCTGIRIEDRAVIKMLQAVMNDPTEV
jgi:hypothetical protein